MTFVRPPLRPEPPYILYYSTLTLGCLCVCALSHHKLLLRAAHAGASLRVLVRSHQQLDQPGDGSLLPQGGVVGGTQRQVADQTHRGLEGGGGGG